ncbi:MULTISPECIES: hypothetical protein [unclassified Clostridium]|nr:MULTISPECIES: hypothetical protein [unclassified Clostridium]
MHIVFMQKESNSAAGEFERHKASPRWCHINWEIMSLQFKRTIA